MAETTCMAATIEMATTIMADDATVAAAITMEDTAITMEEDIVQ